MNAQQARQITEENSGGLNPIYLKSVLERIEFDAKLGDSYILYPLSNKRNRDLLTAELIKLGYEVTESDNILTVRW